MVGSVSQFPSVPTSPMTSSALVDRVPPQDDQPKPKAVELIGTATREELRDNVAEAGEGIDRDRMKWKQKSLAREAKKGTEAKGAAAKEVKGAAKAATKAETKKAATSL